MIYHIMYNIYIYTLWLFNIAMEAMAHRYVDARMMLGAQLMYIIQP